MVWGFLLLGLLAITLLFGPRAKTPVILAEGDLGDGRILRIDR